MNDQPTSATGANGRLDALYHHWDSDPAYSGAAVASALNQGVDPALLARAATVFAQPASARAVLLREFTPHADLFVDGHAAMQRAADRVVAGASIAEAFAPEPLRPDCWTGLAADWDRIVSRFADAGEHPERIAVVPAGAVSDVLAHDRDLYDDGYHYVEYATEVLARVDLGGGLEAVLLPPVISAARGYDPGHEYAQVDFPGTTYLQIDQELLPPGTIARIEQASGMPIPAGRPHAAQLSTAREQRRIVVRGDGQVPSIV